MRGRALPAPIYTVIGAAAITAALGFARFWRGLARDAAWIRPALGWATAQEVGYPAL